MKVLLVDDSATMRRILKGQLTLLGLTDIIEAGNGKLAIDTLTSTPGIDLVLLDWNMPEMDGFTCLKQIRANPALKAVKVIMCTSEADKAKVVEAIKAGANNYIVKPFTPETIKEKIGL
ncbi:MAG: response regulator [Chitinispirillaceae bacterium]|jgi:two-component system chemotaxis response regulator CheY|nr:response regulator [Chitinispirillaceae bacterium]